jgi:DNA-binding CsgD family transcriptional regulator
VLWQVTQGHTSKEIAARLGLSARTVERHLGSIYAKVGARGRADAIAIGLRMGPSGEGSPADGLERLEGTEG